MTPDATPPSEVTTVSGLPLKTAYGPGDVPGAASGVVALPGEAPFLRGAFTEGYRSKPWRIFQLSGFGNPEDEGERIRYLLEKGETGFIMEHDRMTADHLYDVDHPEVLARPEDVGLSGAVQLSARDTALVVEGIDQTKYYAHPGGAVVQHAPFALAAYWTVARRRGVDIANLTGTGQSDFFLTYLGCITKQQIPARDGLKINCDIVDFCARNVPRWVPVSIAGYNGADTGLNAYQELGSVFACAIEHLDETVRRGTLPVEEIARSLGGVNFRVGMEFMEDIAKLRVARKMWHDLLVDRYGITDPRALKLRIHVVTAGSAMTYQEPMNNIVRGTLMALASVLGGVQSLGVSGYDEALSIPSEEAHHMSVRIQQILMHETNLAKVVDPLGGSYYLEALSADLEAKAWEFLAEIEAEGGFVASLDSGWLHGKAMENQYELENQMLTGRREVVGVNIHTGEGDPFGVDGFRGSDDVFDRAMARLKELRRTRDTRAAMEALRGLRSACAAGENVMYPMLEAVGADASLGEIGEVFREVYGDWKVPISF
jgi:methylmalonyl-CoA mutase N-terminal domain/subunit